jgi:hypothetical protein
MKEDKMTKLLESLRAIKEEELNREELHLLV